MFKTLKRLFKNEEGQALVLLALGLVVLLGFTAIAVDYGYLAWQRRNLQNAADSAALAAARELPNESQVESVAKTYAQKYAPKDTLLEIDSRRDPGNSNAVIVDVAHTYNTFFARVLGSNSERVSATATAEKLPDWMGEALPLINVGFDYSVENELGAWEKVAPGIFGSIESFYTRNSKDEDRLYFEIKYLPNGIKVYKGVDKGNKGLGGNLQIKDGLEVVLNRDSKFYLFSLSAEVIKSGKVAVNGSTEKINIGDLKNKDVINPDQLVLIEVDFSYEGKWKHNNDIELEFTGNIYDLVNTFPTEHLNSGGNSSRLIK